MTPAYRAIFKLLRTCNDRILAIARQAKIKPCLVVVRCWCEPCQTWAEFNVFETLRDPLICTHCKKALG